MKGTLIAILVGALGGVLLTVGSNVHAPHVAASRSPPASSASNAPAADALSHRAALTRRLALASMRPRDSGDPAAGQAQADARADQHMGVVAGVGFGTNLLSLPRLTRRNSSI
jgi:hypothetical protein